MNELKFGEHYWVMETYNSKWQLCRYDGTAHGWFSPAGGGSLELRKVHAIRGPITQTPNMCTEIKVPAYMF